MGLVVQILVMIIKLYGVAVLLRFFMQLFRADFYNPISQSIVKLTNPVLVPIRKLVPGYGGVDIASLLMSFLIGGIALFLLYAVVGVLPHVNALQMFLLALLQLGSSILSLFFILLIARIIISFVMMGQNYMSNPFAEVIIQLTQPIIGPFQRMIPPVGVLDFSPIVVFILIWIGERLLNEFALAIVPGVGLI